MAPSHPVRRMLAIGPDATRRPAARTLLELLRWVQEERTVDATVVLLDGGPLVDAFDEVATVRIAPRLLTAPLQLGAALDRPALGRTGRDAWLRRALAPAADLDVVLASATVLPAVALLPAGTAPLVVHLHELDDPPADGGLASAALVVVPTAEVAERAVRAPGDGGFGVPEGRIRHHPGPVAPPSRHRPPARDDVALVAGCGPVAWRAGTDLFVALAAAVGSDVGGRAVHWSWLGDHGRDSVGADIADEIALRGLRHRVHMVGEVAEGADYLAATDLLALTTRDDPYPLAAVDAALVGTPVVGFRPGTALLAAAGQDDRRVDHLDVDALAAQVVDLLSSPDRARLVAAPQARAAARATTPLAAPDLWADIERAAAGRAER